MHFGSRTWKQLVYIDLNWKISLYILLRQNILRACWYLMKGWTGKRSSQLLHMLPLSFYSARLQVTIFIFRDHEKATRWSWCWLSQQSSRLKSIKTGMMHYGNQKGSENRQIHIRCLSSQELGDKEFSKQRFDVVHFPEPEWGSDINHRQIRNEPQNWDQYWR